MSACWYVKNLGDPLLADVPLEQHIALFNQHFNETGSPDRMALYMRHESEGQLHCDLKLYFTPESVEVALICGARPCGAPSMAGLGLIAGAGKA